MSSAPAKTRVFISSTYGDLVEHRRAVTRKLQEWGFDPIYMEEWPADPRAPVEVSEDRTKDADVLVGIYAWKYGSYPPGSQRSFIEYELDAARDKKIPLFLFDVDESYNWPDGSKFKDTGQEAERLAAFKKAIRKGSVVKTFSSPDRLADEVCRALVFWERERKVGPDLSQLLQRVERGVTESLAQRTASRSLDFEIRWRDRVRGPLGAEEGEDALRPLPPGGIAELFRDRSRLLILGGPGSGKTVALERLALDLLHRIELLPVPLSLASWKPTDSDLTEWLVRELNDQLSLLPEIGRKSVEGGRLVPLLDGLDEIAESDRPACVKAILGFGGPLAVTCRTVAYERLPEPFHLQADVILEPVDEESADRYFAQMGPKLDVLRAAVREHESLRELARTPLWLKLMGDAFEEAPAETLQELAASSPEEQPHRVVRAYVDQMEKRPGSQRYGTAPTRRRLTWLARQMRTHRMKRFEIELLQPVWLPTLAERWLYAVLTRGIAGGLMTAVPALLDPFLLPAGLAAGALAGVVDALPVWRLPAGSPASALVRQRAVRVLVISAVSFTAFFSLSQSPLPLSLLFGLVFGLVFGTRPGDLEEHTRVFETLSWTWSSKRGFAGALVGVLATASLAGLVLVFPEAAGQMTLFRGVWPAAGALSGALGFFFGGVLGGLRGTPAERRRTPNVGLRRGLRKLGEAVLRTAALTVPAGFALGFSVRMGPTGAVCGALVALFAGLWFSGLDLLQHWTTRAMLSATGRIPWRWVRFLDHATDRGLLYRVERGYEFPHDFVRDYYCALSEPEEAE